jgi:hypothetical protein
MGVPYCPNPECDQKTLKKGENCPKCGTLAKEFGLREAIKLREQKAAHKKMIEGEAIKLREQKAADKKMTEAENAIESALLEGEEIKLQYSCFRNVMSPPSAVRQLLVGNGSPQLESKKGVLLFTNDNMIFIQREGAWSPNFAQALRIPLEQIIGVVSGGTLMQHIRITIGTGGVTQQYEFTNLSSTKTRQEIHEVRADIENLLKQVREEKKRLAQEALTKGTVPQMIFCKYCGARNKSDRSTCANCGALL